MRIQLKQDEIVAALRQFITLQGINLVGKSLDISFTAGRKDSGLSADVTIEDIELPDLTEESVAAKPALTVVPSAAVSTTTPVGGFAVLSAHTLAVDASAPVVAEVPAKSLFS